MLKQTNLRFHDGKLTYILRCSNTKCNKNVTDSPYIFEGSIYCAECAEKLVTMRTARYRTDFRHNYFEKL